VIVVDTSILIPAFVDAPSSARARRVIDPRARWVLPPMWRFEFTSAMATLIRAGEIDPVTAYGAMDDARTAVVSREVPVDQGQVIRVSIRHKISAYDAQYIALADEYGVVCVTSDKDLLKKAPDQTISLDAYLK
jgi:predicted nucleic acid-binding protein